MSQLVSYAAGGNVKGQGAKLGSATLSAVGAAAVATILDGGTLIVQLTAPINTTAPLILADDSNGHQFQGQPSITLSGAGAILAIEWL